MARGFMRPVVGSSHSACVAILGTDPGRFGYPFDDLGRRQTDNDTQVLLCPAPAGTTQTSARAASVGNTATAPATSLTKGIGRVH